MEFHAGLSNLLADRPRRVQAQNHGLEALGQVLDQVQHHFLGAADHERMGHVDDAVAHCHDTWWAR